MNASSKFDRSVSLPSEKVAVVTGASSGVGKAIALSLATQGFTVCLVARNAAKLQAAVDSAPEQRSRLRPYPTDIAAEEGIERLSNCILQDVGRVDTLVHSAGVISLGPIESSPVESMDSQYRSNVRGPYLLTQTLLPALKACQGQVIFINSTAGVTARANVGQYAASKHALKAIADSLREEVNADGVRVLSVYLGRTATPMQRDIHEIENKSYRPDRLIQPEEVAAIVAGLLSVQQSAEITEITLRPMLKPTQG